MATKPKSGNPVNNGGDTIMGTTDLKVGSEVTYPSLGKCDQFIKGVETSDPIGNRDHRAVAHHPQVKGRITSMPSGWAVDFAVDVGEGLQSLTTTWPADGEQSGKGEFTFLHGNVGQNKDYNALAT